MNPWLILLPVTVLFLIGSVFSYRADLRNGPVFMPVYVFTCIGCAFAWVWLARRLDDLHQIFVMSLVWDLLMVVCFYLLPLALFEFKFNRWAWFGFGLMLVGLAVVKVKGV